VGFERAAAAPPGPLYVFPGEQLVVDSWSSVAAAPLYVKARVLTPQGRIQTSMWTHTPSGDRSLVTTYHDLAEGWLLHVSVYAGSTSYRRGACYVRVQFQRGQGAVGVDHGILIADYACFAGGLVWPGGQIRSSVEGPGLLRSITGTDPPAGSEISETVPTGARWRLLSMYFTLITNAMVANRYVNLLFDDGTAIFARTSCGYSQAAGLSEVYSALPHSQRGDLGYVIGTPLGVPSHQLSAGWRIRTLTASIQAGDNFTAPQLEVEEWIEP
jgi:hypothetical protein